MYHDLQVRARSGSARLESKHYGIKKLLTRIATTAEGSQRNTLQLRTANALWSASFLSSDTASIGPTAASAVLYRATAQSCVPAWVAPCEFCAGGKVDDPRPYRNANRCYEERVDPLSERKDIVKAWRARLRVKIDIEAGEDVAVPKGRRNPLQQQQGRPERTA